MPPAPHSTYSNDDVEDEVKRRIEARDRAMRDAGIDRQMTELKGRLEEVLAQRSTVVKKNDLDHAVNELRAYMADSFVKKVDSFDMQTRQVLTVMVREHQQSLVMQEKQSKWYETLWGRAGITAGLIVALVQIAGLLYTVLHK